MLFVDECIFLKNSEYKLRIQQIFCFTIQKNMKNKNNNEVVKKKVNSKMAKKKRKKKKEKS